LRDELFRADCSDYEDGCAGGDYCGGDGGYGYSGNGGGCGGGEGGEVDTAHRTIMMLRGGQSVILNLIVAKEMATKRNGY